MTKQRDRVAKVFEGKSILVTGAAGYLGVVLLELLLRCCPGIRNIYIVLREKKGVQPECRKDVIFKKKIFSSLHEKQPEVFDKVHVVAGDVSLPNLGMSQSDLERIRDQVSIVYHVAACISFLKPLRFMILQNVVGTLNVINLCRELKQINCLVYTSTAYSNANRPEIEERIYRLPFPVQCFLDELNSGNDEKLNKLVSQCQPAWPNFYTFSKCLAENLLLENSDLPVAILRPSIIISCWKGIHPGFVEEGSGMVDVAIAIGKGFIRVLNCEPSSIIDIVPVDLVANAHVVSAWKIIRDRICSPLVVNCITSDVFPCSVDIYTRTLFEMSIKHPLPKSYQKPSLTLQSNTVMYWIISLFEHYIPAYTIDLLLKISGRKPRLVRLYRFFDFSMKNLKHFLFTTYSFETENIKMLAKELQPEDREDLYLDRQDFHLDSIASTLPTGAPFYKWDIDRKPFNERKRVTQMRYLFTTFIKGIVLVFTCLLFSILFTQVKQLHSHSYFSFI